MRLLLLLLVALWACASPGSRSARACGWLEVDNQNYNRTRVIHTASGEPLGSVEGLTRARLVLCQDGTQASFTLDGFANSFHTRLEGGFLLDSHYPTYLVITSDPGISYVYSGV